MRRYKYNKEITAGGGTVNVNLDSAISVFRLYSATITLTSSWTFQATDTPADGDEFDFILNLDVTPAGNSITIFGYALPTEALTKQCMLNCRYDGTAWQTRMRYNYEETGWLEGDRLKDGTTPLAKLDTTVVADNLTEGSIWKGKSGGGSEELVIKTDKGMIMGNGTTPNLVIIGGDFTIANDGTGTIGNNKITTPKILDRNVTTDKIALLAVTGDELKDGTIVSNKIADSQIKEQHLTSETTSATIKGTLAVVHMKSADLKPLLDGTTNDLFAVKEGDLILCIKLWTQTAAGVAATVTAGPDANARAAGADTDGILKAANVNATGVYSSDDVAGTYMGALQAFGAFEVDADGWITVTSSVDVSATGIVCGATIFYCPH